MDLMAKLVPMTFQGKVGANDISGCDGRIFFFDELVHHFQLIGKVTLNKLVNSLTTGIWDQGRMSVDELHLVG